MPARIDQSNLPLVYQMVTSPKAPEGPILSEEMGMVYTANRIYNLEKKIEAARQWEEARRQEYLQLEEVRRQEHLQKMEEGFSAMEERFSALEEVLKSREGVREQIDCMKADLEEVLKSREGVRARIERMEAEFARAREISARFKEEQRLREEQEFSISKFVKELFSKLHVMFESVKVFASIIKLDR